MRIFNSTIALTISALALILGTFIGILTVGCENDTGEDTYNTASPVSALSISPSSVTLGIEDTYTVLTASGGTGPYSWSVSDSSLGTIPKTSAGTITYTRETESVGANQITVIDANKWSASAIVMQNSDTNNVTVE